MIARKVKSKSVRSCSQCYARRKCQVGLPTTSIWYLNCRNDIAINACGHLATSLRRSNASFEIVVTARGHIYLVLGVVTGIKRCQVLSASIITSVLYLHTEFMTVFLRLDTTRDCNSSSSITVVARSFWWGVHLISRVTAEPISSNFVSIVKLNQGIVVFVFFLLGGQPVCHFQHRSWPVIVKFELVMDEQTKGWVSSDHLVHAKILVHNTVHFGNHRWHSKFDRRVVILLRIFVLPSLDFGIDAGPGCRIHDFGENLPCRSESLAMRAPAGEEVDEEDVVLPPGKLDRRLIEADGIFSILVQLVDGLHHRIVLEDDIVLLNVAAGVAFANPVRRDGLFDNVLRYVLVGAQETNNVHGQIVALEVHHRYVKIHPNPRVLVEIEGQVLIYSRVQERPRFHE